VFHPRAYMLASTLLHWCCPPGLPLSDMTWPSNQHMLSFDGRKSDPTQGEQMLMYLWVAVAPARTRSLLTLSRVHYRSTSSLTQQSPAHMPTPTRVVHTQKFFLSRQCICLVSSKTSPRPSSPDVMWYDSRCVIHACPHLAAIHKNKLPAEREREREKHYIMPANQAD
jgi:hypothetical protein